MIAAKSGFVIPRNKLSGSLISVSRSGKKLRGSDASNEEISKETYRKTKWGPDLSQDTTVRRGKTLAYETRVDQISRQLKSELQEIGDNQDVSLAAEVLKDVSLGNGGNNEKLKLLDLERNELIGEILKLNPSYKTPPDYKPVLKEDIIPIPARAHPGYDFIGLICGPGGDTVKRLEKETGVTVQIYGTKAISGEKRKISPSDVNETHVTYDELHVHVSADTFERIDAAITLIELLVTPNSGTPAPASVSTPTTSIPTNGDDASNHSQVSATSSAIPPIVSSQGVVQPVTELTLSSLHGPSQPQSMPPQWISMAGPPRTPSLPSFAFTPLPTTSAPNLTSHNSSLVSSFAAPPVPPHSSAFVLHNQPPGAPRSQQQPMQSVQPQYFHFAGHGGLPNFFSISDSPITSTQLTAPMLTPISRPPPFTPSVGFSSVMQSPPLFPPQAPLLRTPLNNSAPNAVPPFSFPFQLLRPISPFNSAGQPQSAPIISTPNFTSPTSASTVPNNTSSSLLPSFTPLKPHSVAAPIPQHPSSADFTFQAPNSQGLVSHAVFRPVGQSATQITVQSQSPAIRPAMPNSALPPFFQAFPRQLVGQPQAHSSPVPFAGNPNATLQRPRFAAPPPQMPHFSSPFPVRPGDPGQFQPNYRPVVRPEQHPIVPNQQWSNNPPLPSVKPGFSLSMGPHHHHVYDPFSPTSLPRVPWEGGDVSNERKPESDPEYEDLMASVGVR